MKTLQIQLNIKMTNEYFNSEKTQEFINDIKTGKLQREFKENKGVIKVTVFYNTIKH